MTYRAPLQDLSFVLGGLLDAQQLAQMPLFSDYSTALADSILGEAARFAETILEPLNQSGDREGARWTPEGVITASGFKNAYEQFVAGGWTQLGAEAQYGGQPVPEALSVAVREIWASANLAFKLCPMLTQGAIEALQLCGSPQQRARYLPKMVSGEWTGTMVLTEPQAGSDLGLIRTRAVPQGDRYRLFGQKIFITWGDHDLTDNIIHLVLARIEGAPAGTKGISLFIVPKVTLKADDSLDVRNEIRTVSIEHKLGIHASPTCVLSLGDEHGALGELVGEANRGLEYMFIMMNSARLSVGVEGYAVAERALQRATEWARARVQGKVAKGVPSGAPIIHHPDIARMLLTQKAGTEAMRALSMYAALQLDLARHGPEKMRDEMLLHAELLIPIVKAWCTELGNELASLGVQVHGGMGFIEETGAAQYLRDARITSIYEGTTGIQANDLLGRKLARDQGAAARAFIALLRQDASVKKESAMAAAVDLLDEATQLQLQRLAAQPAQALAVAVPYLMLFGFVAAGWLMARSASVVTDTSLGLDAKFVAAKQQTARFYLQHLLPRVLTLAETVKTGAACVAEANADLI